MRPLINTLLFFVTGLLATASYQVQARYSLEMIEGTVISAEAGRLIVKDEQNKDHTLAVDSGAQIIVEGKMAQLEDIRMGMKADVTLDAGKVIAVNATKRTRLDSRSR